MDHSKLPEAIAALSKSIVLQHKQRETSFELLKALLLISIVPEMEKANKYSIREVDTGRVFRDFRRSQIVITVDGVPRTFAAVNVPFDLWPEAMKQGWHRQTEAKRPALKHPYDTGEWQ